MSFFFKQKFQKYPLKTQNYYFNNVQKPEPAASHFAPLTNQKQIHGLNLYQPMEPGLSLVITSKKNKTKLLTVRILTPPARSQPLV